VKKTIRYSALIAAGIGVMLSACSESTAPASPTPVQQPAPIPSQLLAEGATNFTATVGTRIEPGPAVRVLDSKNRPVAGVSVSFAPGRVVVSDTDGIARFGPWQLDTLAREYLVVARVIITGREELEVAFRATATPGSLAHLVALSGNNQVGRPAVPLPNQLHVKATDIYNNPLRGIVVSFSVMSGGGDIEPSTRTTNLLGVATSGMWTLGTAGPQQVKARTGALQALFDATFCAAGTACDLIPSSLAYVRDGAVWVSSLDGPVLIDQSASRPSWSPDGSRLAFFKVNTNREEEAICITSERFSVPACTPVDHVSSDAASAARISWSPDSRTLALARPYYGPGDSQLLFVDVETMTIRRHGTIDQGVWSASWSPDGKQIAIATDSRVYLADAAGSALQVLLSYPVWELAWAPDGQKIAAITLGCDLWECFGVDIGLVDPQTKEFERLEPGQGGFGALAWAPDSHRLAYSSWDGDMSDVRILNVATGATDVVLTNASDPSWRR